MTATRTRKTMRRWGEAATPLTHLGGMRFWSPGAGEYRFERSSGGWRVIQFDQAWRRYDPLARIEPAAVPVRDYPGRDRSAELEVAIMVEVDSGVMIRPPLTEPIRLATIPQPHT